MPYATNDDLPSYVKKYSKKLQSQWRHVWMTVYKNTKNETRASRAANSVLKKRFSGKESMIKNTRDDYFLQLVDGWLGNIKG